MVADNVLFPGAPELLDYLHVPYVPATDAVSGQACLQAAADVDAKFLKRAENDLKVYKTAGRGRCRGGPRGRVVAPRAVKLQWRAARRRATRSTPGMASPRR